MTKTELTGKPDADAGITSRLQSIIDDIDEKIDGLRGQRPVIEKAFGDLVAGVGGAMPSTPKSPPGKTRIPKAPSARAKHKPRPDIADESDPCPCGTGPILPVVGSQPWIVMEAIERSAPRWMTASWIFDAVPELGLMNKSEIPKTFNVAINKVLKQLRDKAYHLPCAEYKRDGNRYLYRINREPADAKEGT